MWRGTLGGLAAEPAGIDTQGPGTIVIGEVVSLAVAADNERSLAVASAGTKESPYVSR